MTTIRTWPAWRSHSPQYQHDLRRAVVEIDMHRRLADWPLQRIVWHARSLYQQAWAAELERT